MGLPVLAAVGVAKGVASVLSNAFGGKLVYGIKKEEFAQRLTNERWFRYAYSGGYNYAGEIPVGMSIGEFYFQLFGKEFTTYQNPELAAQTGVNYAYNFQFDPNSNPMGVPHSWSAEKMDGIIQAYWKPTPQQMLRMTPNSPYYKEHKDQIVAVIGEPTVTQTAFAGLSGSGSMLPILIVGGILTAGILLVRR